MNIKKSLRLFILFALFATFMVSSVLAGRNDRKRKLPVGSYITSAKIEILSREPERVKLALAYLSDLAEFYGPHSEAYYWSSQIYVDYIDQVASPMDKREHVQSLVAYADSLHASCDNKEIKKKYRKGCSGFADEVDSIKVLRWREYYNNGAETLQEIQEAQTDMKAEEDSASQVYYQEKIDALRDTAQAYFELAIILDSSDTRPWLGIGNLLAELGELEEANEMLIKALPSAEGDIRANLLLQVAYNYVNNEQYCESIDFFRQYLDGPGAEDVPNMINLSAIYSRCEKYDSAFVVYQKALVVDPESVDALIGAGRYHNQQAISALDSSRHYADLGETAKGEEWTAKRQASFADAREMFARAFAAADTSNVAVAGEYGLVLFLLEDFEAAIEPFLRVANHNPTDKDNWATLGTCYLKIKDFDKCARAYEKVVEIDPDNRVAWESLEGLYLELKETENLKKAREHLK